jgi:hypothetical protein
VAESPFDKYLGTTPTVTPTAESATDPFARYLGEQPAVAVAAEKADMGSDPFAKYLGEQPTDLGPEGGYLTSEPVREEEIASIAKKYGQDPKQFIETAQWAGVPVYTKEGAALPQMGRVFAGEVGERFLLGIPQFIAKKLESDENARKALDEVRELRKRKQSSLGAVTEAVSGIAAPAVISQPVTTLGKAALGIGTGVAGGLGQSREDEELSSALVGGALG